MEKILIAGGRNYNDYEEFKRRVRHYINMHNIDLSDIELVSGGARGVDSMAERIAKEFKIPIKVFPADWDTYGKAAGVIRNKQMAEYVGANGTLIAFWDGKSRGTGNMIETAGDYNINICVIRID